MIKQFILDQVKEHPADLASLIAKQFTISRQRANFYITREVKNGNLIRTGTTKTTKYFLSTGNHVDFKLELLNLEEYEVYAKYIKPLLLNYSENLQRNVAYGFTEIINNAIDHSGGTSIFVQMDIDEKDLKIVVMDNGVGIFRKIQNALKLESMREAILHLSKGKFTTDPSNHTGEGIFFTSRIFDKFSILSDDLFYTFQRHDWFLSHEKIEEFGKGTYIEMVIAIDSTKTAKEIMDQYSGEEIGFGKTIVAVALSADPNDPHVSRSQAKRLLMGLDKFKEVMLDFRDVRTVGQAFVDEVFRVFQNEHPEIKINYFNANPEVEAMIKRGLNP